MSSVFGGSKQQSSTTNQAYPMLSSALSGQINNATGGSNQLASMLGINGAQGQDDAFKNWQNSTGYQFGLNQGSQAITGNAAATGLMNSGATAKALNTYGQNYANTQYGNYTNQLQGLVNSGNQAAGVVAGAGQQSQSSGSSNNGAGSTIAGVGSLLAK